MIKLIYRGAEAPTIDPEKYIWINGNESKVWNGVAWEDIKTDDQEKISDSLLPDTIVRKSEFEGLISALDIHSGADGAPGREGNGILSQDNYYLVSPTDTLTGDEEIVENPIEDEYNKWLRERIVTVTEEYPYLWNRIKTNYTYGGSNWSQPVIMRYYVDYDAEQLVTDVESIVSEKIAEGEFDEPLSHVIGTELGEGGTINAAIIEAHDDAITQSVTIGSKVWIKYSRETVDDEWKRTGNTEPCTKSRSELVPSQDTDTVKWELGFISDSITSLNIGQGVIQQMILDDNGNLKAGIEIIGDASTEPNGHGGSKIILTADNVDIDGALTATSIKSKLVDSDKLTADQINVDTITAKTVNAENTDLSTIIVPGQFSIFHNNQEVFKIEWTDDYGIQIKLWNNNKWCTLNPTGVTTGDISQDTEITNAKFNSLGSWSIFSSQYSTEFDHVIDPNLYPTVTIPQFCSVYSWWPKTKIENGTVTTYYDPTDNRWVSNLHDINQYRYKYISNTHPDNPPASDRISSDSYFITSYDFKGYAHEHNLYIHQGDDEDYALFEVQMHTNRHDDWVDDCTVILFFGLQKFGSCDNNFSSNKMYAFHGYLDEFDIDDYSWPDVTSYIEN